MNESDWLALYQQRPAARGGTIVKSAWLANRYVRRGDAPLRVGQSWDTASKAKEWNAPSVCLTFAEFRDRAELWDVYLARVEYPELRRAAEGQARKWAPYGLSVVLIEDKSSGQQLLQQLRKETSLPVIGVEPETDKETRLRTETDWLEAGNLWLPDATVGAEWLDAFLAELTTFPASTWKDQVDALSQWLRWRRTHPIVAYEKLVPVVGRRKESARVGTALDPESGGPGVGVL